MAGWATAAEAPRTGEVAHRLSRRLGTVLIGAGVLLVAYAAVLLLWRDP